MNWSDYAASVHRKCIALETPFHASFEVTPFCNFKCNMCYVRLDPIQAQKQGRLLTTKEWINLAIEAKKAGVVTLEITGGEALLREDFPVLYEKIIKMGFLVTLRSNGYYWNDDTFDLLQHWPPQRISITVYGASDDTYQRVCGVSDGFSVVSGNILRMREVGLPTSLTMTLTNDNIHDQKAVASWANKNGFSVLATSGLFTPVRGAKRSIKHLQVHYPAIDNALKEGKPIMPRMIQNREVYDNPFWMCRGFGGKFCISWDGRMTLCNGMTSIWEETVDKNLRDAYKDLYCKLKTVKRPQKCTQCQIVDYCSACPNRFFSETGELDETCDDICNIAYARYAYYTENKPNPSDIS